ncbi:MAG: coproporphyrinogen dehydrogenase HemZ [Defluviitaleaceae bacterium]|nr:coproporphyrinogen dehydrogenase HemZ [Defluviitaleaceae bacterium]
MINCILRGHDFVNEVQVTAQLFFAGEKFAFVDDVAKTGYTVKSEMIGDFVHAFVLKDCVELAHYCVQIDHSREYLNPRRYVMLAVYHALQKAVGAYTPWGTLTGIRPSKLVREWLDGGFDNDKVISILMNPFCCSEEKARLALTVAHAEKRVERRINNTIGLYVSVPFCPSRCVYCSFNTSFKFADETFLERYIAALIGECHEKAVQVRDMGATISSIYVGGGTPTFLPENLLERLLGEICEAFSGTSPLEFTVEAGRPDTLTAAKLKLLRKHSVNRIAVNPQTLNDQTLTTIGRNHTADDFFKAFCIAREVGFDCINTDIIAGLPNETPNDMRRNMEALAKLSPENITIHTLAVKRASRLNEQRASSTHTDSAPDPRIVESMLSIAAEYTAKMGHSPYYLYRQKNMVGLFENIGYSLPNHECLYNVGMMAEVQTILGIGAGAVSKFVEGTKITREFNAKNPEIYIERRDAK